VNLLRKVGRYLGIAIVLGGMAGSIVAQEPKQLVATTEALIKTEELLLDLSPEHVKIVEWLQKFPTSPRSTPPKTLSQITQGIFTEPFDPELLKAKENPHEGDSGPVHYSLEIASEQPQVNTPLSALIKHVASWGLSNLGVTSAKLKNPKTLVFQTKLEGSGSLKNGKTFGAKMTQELVWKKTGEDWALAEWNQQSATLKVSPKNFFTDATESSIKNSSTRWGMQKFEKREKLKEVMETGRTTLPDPKYLRF